MIQRALISTLMLYVILFFFFFNDTATTEIYTLSLHDALPISSKNSVRRRPSRPPFCLEQRQAFSAGANAGADGAFVRGAGLDVLCAEGDAADLLACIKARRGDAGDLATIANDGSGEGPAGFRIDHAVAPAIEINGGDIAIEIEIAAGEHATHVGAERIFVAGKGRGEELDALVWLVFDRGDVAAVEGEGGLAI